MKAGDLVRIRPEWCDSPEEHDMVFRISEIDDLRASISPVVWPYGIVPIERVEIAMIEPAECTNDKENTQED